MQRLHDAEAAAREAAERQAHEQALAERPDEELLAEAGMPEPESLTTAEEVQAFLKTALPQRLKTRALRRLWRLNPVLANLDGLVDYGEDYTDATRVIENMQTVYQVGKGMFDKFADPDPEPEEEPLVAEAPEDSARRSVARTARPTPSSTVSRTSPGWSIATPRRAVRPARSGLGHGVPTENLLSGEGGVSAVGSATSAVAV